MGHNGQGLPDFNLPGVGAAGTPLAAIDQNYCWMFDVSTRTAQYPTGQLCQPKSRHDPTNFMYVDNLSGANPWVNQVPGSVPVFSYPRLGTPGANTLPTVGSPRWIGGAFNGGYDRLWNVPFITLNQLQTEDIFRSHEDVVAYKEFNFIPRMCRDDGVYMANMVTEPPATATVSVTGQAGVENARIEQKLEKWETRIQDKVRVKSNYHGFEIDVFPEYDVHFPEPVQGSHMAGTKKWGEAIGKTMFSGASTPSGAYPEQLQNALRIKRAKWFAKIRFIVAKRDLRNINVDSALRLVGLQGDTQPDVNDFLFDLAPFLRKNATAFVNGNIDFATAFTPSPLIDSKNIAVDAFELSRAKTMYRSDLVTAMDKNLPDRSLKIIYDKTVELNHRKGKRHAFHSMETLKGKVLEYFKQSEKRPMAPVQADPPGDPTQFPTGIQQEIENYPVKDEYRFWAVVHCHNCQLTMSCNHVFKFDA